MNRCRACRSEDLSRVLDLGQVPAGDHFPDVDEPVSVAESAHSLAMNLCRACGLAQLADDDTAAEEPRGIEPQVLRDQAASAVERVAAAGWLNGRTVTEFHSPHGGTWTPLMTERGFATACPADLVVDSFGMMHEPDQRHALAQRAAATLPGGVLLLQFHSLAAIVRHGQWNALRHGHFAYYSLASLMRLLKTVGLNVVTAWSFDLYGGTILIAAVHGNAVPDDLVTSILSQESGTTDPEFVAQLQTAADDHVHALRSWLQLESDAGRKVYAYGAASRAAALFQLAEVDRTLLRAVADASPQKHGRRMPGTDVPIIPPAELIAANPDRVLLTVPDLIDEVRRSYPQLDGRWHIDNAQLGSTSEEGLHK
jgi:hypothetical protein